MRKIDKIVIHCAYTPPSMDIGLAEIDRWHKDRGWWGIGYHFVIRRDGKLEKGRPLEMVGAHARGHNRTSIGICLVGGKAQSKNGGGRAQCNFTSAQWRELDALVTMLMNQHHVAIEGVIGHNDVSPKMCPTFDVKAWRDTLAN